MPTAECACGEVWLPETLERKHRAGLARAVDKDVASIREWVREHLAAGHGGTGVLLSCERLREWSGLWPYESVRRGPGAPPKCHYVLGLVLADGGGDWRAVDEREVAARWVLPHWEAGCRVMDAAVDVLLDLDEQDAPPDEPYAPALTVCAVGSCGWSETAREHRDAIVLGWHHAVSAHPPARVHAVACTACQRVLVQVGGSDAPSAALRCACPDGPTNEHVWRNDVLP